MDDKSNKKSHFNADAGEYQIKWRKNYKLAKGELGWQNGVQKEYILPARKWLLGVWPPIRRALEDYIRVSGIQPNKGKHNLKSSWTQCANLFFPFRHDRKMRAIFASFLSEQLHLSVTNIEGIEFEYAAPGKLEPKRLLGELKGMRGSGQTSPDVAVIFGCEDGRSGIYLLENKYTEHSFYDCSGAKKLLSKAYQQRGLPPTNNPERCKRAIDILRNPETMCQQQGSWGRKYWTILKDTINEDSLGKCGHCPALKGGYQLFRQQALAQGIADDGLFDHVISGVAYDSRNEALIGCLRGIGMDNFTSGWSQLFNTSVKFCCFTHQDLFSYVKQSKNDTAMNWVKYIERHYDYKS